MHWPGVDLVSTVGSTPPDQLEDQLGRAHHASRLLFGAGAWHSFYQRDKFSAFVLAK